MSWTQRYMPHMLRHDVRNSARILPVFSMGAWLVTVIRSKRSEAHGQNGRLVMQDSFETRGYLRG
jgi:hypothetical protein